MFSSWEWIRKSLSVMTMSVELTLFTSLQYVYTAQGKKKKSVTVCHFRCQTSLTYCSVNLSFTKTRALFANVTCGDSCVFLNTAKTVASCSVSYGKYCEQSVSCMYYC